MPSCNRRVFLSGLCAALAAPSAFAAADESLTRASEALAALEKTSGGRLGVSVLDSSSPRALAYRAEERFPMCSAFKALAAAALLARVDAGVERLDRKIVYAESDLLSYAPITKAHVGDGVTLGELAAAAIDYSDNTAANLILVALGGPKGLTNYLRSIGDAVTRLDRNEPTLNESTPGDPRDTSTPRAFAEDLRTLLTGDKLSQASREQLESWMVADKVGDARLRAGLPVGWGIGDKTGTGDHGTANTVAIIRPPRRGPLFAAVFLTETDASLDQRNAIHRAVGELIGRTF